MHLDGTCFSFHKPSPGDRSRIRIACECGSVEDLGGKVNLPPDVLANMFRRRGWLVTKRGDRATCPGCQETTRMGKNTQAAAASRDAIRANRKMYQLLDDHYDGEALAYREGWSDLKVAKTAGLAEAYVADIREKGYGPLVDPRAAELRKKLDELGAEIDSTKTAIAEMAKSELGQLEAKLAKLQAELTRVTKGGA